MAENVVVACVLYDDDCEICVWIAALVLRLDRRCRLRPVPIRSLRGRWLLRGLSRERRRVSWHFVADDGRRSSGGRAVLALAALLAPSWSGPPGRAVARLAALSLAGLYGPLARRRVLMSRFVPATSKRRARLIVARRSGASIG